MIDRAARKNLEQARRRYTAGRITTNVELEETVANIASQSGDATVHEVANASWGLYDDLRTYTAAEEDALGRSETATVARWILFLRSNNEFARPRSPSAAGTLVDALIGVFTLGLVRRTSSSTERQSWKSGDFAVWPFRSRMELRREMRRVEDRMRASASPQA
jgi:hypothetical protein